MIVIISGVCGKKTLIQRRQHVNIFTRATTIQGLERGFCCCVAGQRLGQKESLFADAGIVIAGKLRYFELA